MWALLPTSRTCRPTGRARDSTGDVLQADPDFSSEQPDALYLGQFALARLAAGEKLLDSTPLYLRESDAQVPGPRKRAL